jgi:hypothetical protein
MHNDPKASKKSFQSLCEKLLASDSSIMSLTIADLNGEILAQDYGSEYQTTFFEKARDARGRAGVWATLMLGMEREVDEAFGPTEYIVRAHSNGNLVVVPFPNHQMVATFLTKKGAVASRILPKVMPLLIEWKLRSNSRVKTKSSGIAK